MILEPKEKIDKLTHGSQVKVKAQCDDCGVEYKIIYRNYLKSQKGPSHNFDGKTYCSKCAVAKSNKRRGHDKPTRYINNEGYVMLRVRKEKPNGVGWSCYRKEHQVVAEQILGRPLTKEEIIHHIDLDKTNNHPDNLYICSSSEHMSCHKSLESFGLKLYQAGLLDFDNGKYVANVKFRELLEHPEKDNQQPSLSGNTLEGSETRSES